jgi:hypothetical protein
MNLCIMAISQVKLSYNIEHMSIMGWFVKFKL